jgi:hypothetical protein
MRYRDVGKRACSVSFLERLSGKYLNGSDRAFLGSAERRKFAPFRPLVRALGTTKRSPFGVSRQSLEEFFSETQGIRRAGANSDPGPLAYYYYYYYYYYAGS